MEIDEAIEILNNTKREIKTWLGYRDENTKKKVIEENTKKWQAIETLINEYNSLKQIEEAHRIENGQLRVELKDDDKDMKIRKGIIGFKNFMDVIFDNNKEDK